jgi:hypothetical protein
MNLTRHWRAGLALLAAVLVATVVSFSGAASAAKLNNGPGLCTRGQWQYLYTSTGEPFTDQRSCQSYASSGGTLAGIIALGTHFPAPACDFNGGTNDCWAEYLGFGLQPGSLTVAFTRFDSEPYFMADSALVASDGTVSNGPMFGCGFGLTTFYVTGFLADGTPITSNIATSPC